MHLEKPPDMNMIMGGRLIEVTDLKGISVSYEYDMLGNKLSMLNGRKKLTRYTYGALSMIKQVNDADVKTVSYKYDLTMLHLYLIKTKIQQNIPTTTGGY